MSLEFKNVFVGTYYEVGDKFSKMDNYFHIKKDEKVEDSLHTVKTPIGKKSRPTELSPSVPASDKGFFERHQTIAKTVAVACKAISLLILPLYIVGKKGLRATYSWRKWGRLDLKLDNNTLGLNNQIRDLVKKVMETKSDDVNWLKNHYGEKLFEAGLRTKLESKFDKSLFVDAREQNREDLIRGFKEFGIVDKSEKIYPIIHFFTIICISLDDGYEFKKECIEKSLTFTKLFEKSDFAKAKKVYKNKEIGTLVSKILSKLVLLEEKAQNLFDRSLTRHNVESLKNPDLRYIIKAIAKDKIQELLAKNVEFIQKFMQSEKNNGKANYDQFRSEKNIDEFLKDEWNFIEGHSEEESELRKASGLIRGAVAAYHDIRKYKLINTEEESKEIDKLVMNKLKTGLFSVELEEIAKNRSWLPWIFSRRNRELKKV